MLSPTTVRPCFPALETLELRNNPDIFRRIQAGWAELVPNNKDVLPCAPIDGFGFDMPRKKELRKLARDQFRELTKIFSTLKTLDITGCELPALLKAIIQKECPKLVIIE